MLRRLTLVAMLAIVATSSGVAQRTLYVCAMKGRAAIDRCCCSKPAEAPSLFEDERGRVARAACCTAVDLDLRADEGLSETPRVLVTPPVAVDLSEPSPFVGPALRLRSVARWGQARAPPGPSLFLTHCALLI